MIRRLRNASALILVKPRGCDDPLWEATLTAREDEQRMSVHDITRFAAEVVVA
ncbi:MAG: L-lactate dehydrogenase, partial [Microbacterium sp.]|nr:L-lactate dehydrogenase [Microbacterium sp.]